MTISNKVYFSLPDFFGHFTLNAFLIYLWKKESNKFIDNIVIDNFFGSFPCIWNGGRPISGMSISGKHIIKIINYFNDRGISLRFTFTNNLLKEEHFYDTIGNNILKAASNTKVKNSVSVNLQGMLSYIESHYSNLYCVWSTTLGLSDVNKINELSKDHILVLDYTLNNKFDFLKKLKYPENIEILVNERCVENCPYRQDHYKAMNEYSLGLPVDLPKCWFPSERKIYEGYLNPRNSSMISIDSIYKNYLPLGFNKFKIQGRTDPDVLLVERYINYLIKPEYRDEIRNRLLCFSDAHPMTSPNYLDNLNFDNF